MENFIKVRGARQHNLKNIDLDIPKNKLVVFTGVSGSGKSSLAYDTIYAEGQRRYVESLSTYARQFLGIMEKPDLDLIEGLSPAISIDQKTTSKNPRSTVGTVTEIYDYLRLLFARVGHPHCPICGREIASQSQDQIVDSALSLLTEITEKEKKARFLILSPIVSDKKGEFSNLLDNLKSKGYKRVRVDNFIKDLNEELILIKTNKHTIEVVIDSISFSLKDLKNELFLKNLRSRISDSVEQALKLSDGKVIFAEIKDKSFDLPEFPKEFKDHLFSERFACPIDNISLSEIEPRTFSFNSPHGACPKCNGIGKILKVEEKLLFSREISISEGAILPFANIFQNDTWYARLILTVCRLANIDPKLPFKKLNKEKVEILLKGTGSKVYKVVGTNRFGRETFIYETFPGVLTELEKRHAQTDSDWVRAEIEKYMRDRVCPECLGARLKKESLGITIDSQSISQITSLSVIQIISWLKKILDSQVLSDKEMEIGRLILKEIEKRLNFLVSVGLEYLTLDRTSATLSAGEAQRIRLASQIGSGLTGVLYVLDEPTVGLHPRDNQKLIDTLKTLRDLGNTVVVVEHDADMIRQSDFVVDFGPGAGKFGGNVVAYGSPGVISKDRNSLTGQYLNGSKSINLSAKEFSQQLSIIESRNPSISLKKDLDQKLVLYGCSQYNLKNIKVEFPLGKLVVITGVSGSGKSTLLVETLYPALKRKLNPFFNADAGKFSRIEGADKIDKVILIDQSAIGRTPRSNPVTYTKVFDLIREVFAQTREARVAGFKKGRFSFNLKGGRCEACEGQGQLRIEMQFMSDIWVKCDVCNGTRYNVQTLEVNYKGKNISEVLNMTVTEAVEFFHTSPKIVRILETLDSVGLNYIELGQSATTLSGGEAQRVKLATELSKKTTGNTVYILDEPTTGLHFADLEKLLIVLRLLVKRGNSVLLIEHNLDVIKNADWIIDLGPEGGELGGQIVTQGTVSEINKSNNSYTARFLKDSLR